MKKDHSNLNIYNVRKKFHLYFFYSLLFIFFTSCETQKEHLIFQHAYKGNYNYIFNYVKKGKDINITNEIQSSPLIEAVKGNRGYVVKFLLKNGANINQQNKFGRTALMYAFLMGHCELTKLILDKKPDMTIKDNLGKTNGYYFKKSKCYKNKSDYRNKSNLIAQASKVKSRSKENSKSHSSYNFPEYKIRVAILTLDAGKGISKSEATYLTNRIRTAIIELDKFDVISNDQIQKMMEIKALKQAVGEGSCSTKKCIIDLGNALECEKMFVGSVEGAFGEFSISLKLVDVVNQKYEIAKDLRIKDKSNFPDAAIKLVNKLFGI